MDGNRLCRGMLCSIKTVLAAFLAALAVFLTGCGPAPADKGKASGPGTPAEAATTGTAAAGALPTVDAVRAGHIAVDFEAMSIEHRATTPSAHAAVLPFPDADLAEDIEPGTRGGSFVFVAFGEGPKDFNPVTANDSGSNEVNGLMYSALIGFDLHTQQFEPALLKEWYMDEQDKTVWTMKLREGIKWSDGQPITADDVLFTFECIYHPNIPNPGKDVVQVGGKPIEFTKVDDTTVRAKLTTATASFQVLMASVTLLPKHSLEPALRAGTFDQALNINVDPGRIIGSGPFRLKQYDKGQRVILERNPHYFRYDTKGTQLPYLDTLIISYAPDQDQQLLRFKSGTADGFVRPRAQAIADLAAGQRAGGYTLYDCGPGDGANVFWFNLKPGSNPKTGKPYVEPWRAALFNDVRFRRALLHAIDKPSIIATELRGLAVNAWSLESPANAFWHNPDVPKYEYDPERAKALLDEMGLGDANRDGIREDAAGNKVSFTFVTNKGNKTRENIATLIAQDWAEVGVEARPQYVDFNTLVTMTADTFEYDACLLGFGGSLHPSTAMNLYRSSGRTHFWNPQQEKPATEWEAEIDRLAEAFNATLDIKQQRRDFFRIQEIVAEQCPFLPLFTSKVFVAARNKFGNLKPSAMSHELLWNADEIFVRP
ncbi:MAG: ABC transporter substrate-binding protein [Candidatus Sumerlaeaceae bacterium]|nr:ABC transporter substrate-binding protein [Candidatus Sumerlaeaceae bacterium]